MKCPAGKWIPKFYIYIKLLGFQPSGEYTHVWKCESFNPKIILFLFFLLSVKKWLCTLLQWNDMKNVLAKNIIKTVPEYDYFS